jgi:ubiquinone/menaquinone biosynthesis C-methylase UbiE
MSFYEELILPWLVHVSMRQATLTPYRTRVVSAARGRVLEIGVGSGLNLPFYGGGVRQMIGLDPSAKLLSMSRRSAHGMPTAVLLRASAEAIPIEDKSIDTVITTWTLCSVPNVQAALEELRRVLKPSGQVLFVEHGRSPDERVRRWQDRLTPLWKRLTGGCHLNRPIQQLLEQSRFHIERIQTGYMKGPKPMTFMYEGCAR